MDIPVQWKPPGSNLAKSALIDSGRIHGPEAFSAKEGGRSGWYERRLSFDLPCPTLVTMPNHASTSLCHPTETSRFPIAEGNISAAYKSFQTSSSFGGSPSLQYAQVGNAVPVRLGEIAGRLIGEIFLGIIAITPLEALPRLHPSPPDCVPSISRADATVVQTRRGFRVERRWPKRHGAIRRPEDTPRRQAPGGPIAVLDAPRSAATMPADEAAQEVCARETQYRTRPVYI